MHKRISVGVSRGGLRRIRRGSYNPRKTHGWYHIRRRYRNGRR